MKLTLACKIIRTQAMKVVRFLAVTEPEGVQATDLRSESIEAYETAFEVSIKSQSQIGRE